MNHEQNSETIDSSLLDKLVEYLAINPSMFIDINKISRHFQSAPMKLLKLFLHLEKSKIGIRVFSFQHDNPEIILTTHFKFYFYDYNKYCRPMSAQLRLDQKGALLEQYFFSALVENNQQDYFTFYTFRTNSQIEVDFIIKTATNKLYGVEIKKDQFIYAGDLQGLHFFNKSFPEEKTLLVLHSGTRDNYEGIIHILPIEAGIRVIV